MKFNSWRFFLGVSTVFAGPFASAQELPYKYSGVHYDSASEQYFVNDRPKFNIQPMGGAKFLDRIEYSLDDAAFSSYTNGIKFTEEGVHTLRFKAVDPVNNWSPIQSFRIFADLTRPVSQLSWFGESFEKSGKNYISSKSKLVITANDNLSGVSRVVWKNSNGPLGEYKTPQSFEKEGEYKLDFMAIDNVGNMEPWQTYSFILDSTHPESKVNLKGDSYKAGNKLYTKLGSVLEIFSVDTGAGLKEIEMKINGLESQKYERPIALDKKLTKIQFRGIDNVMNTEKWQDFEVHVDTDAPEISVQKVGKYQLLSGKIYATSGFKLDVIASDKDSGLKGLNINGQEKTAQSKDIVTFDKEGTFEVSISAIDNVGNKTAIQNLSVVIDNTPPTSKISTDLALVDWDGVLYSSIPNKLAIQSEDTGVGVHQIEISYDGKTYTKLTESIDFATWKEQQRTIYYRAKDQLGNIEPEKKLTIAIRDRGPVVGLFVETEELGNVPLSEVKGLQGRNVASDKKLNPTPMSKGKKD